MKNEITAELKRAFPSPMIPKKDDAKAPAKDAAGPAPAAVAGQDDKVDTESGKVYDRVSSVIVEEINQDHLLLRGRKSVLYKNRKRMIEIQALVSRKDVLEDDTVVSDSVIENNITVLR
jgi:flagellar L-ring protein precursor FlgH